MAGKHDTRSTWTDTSAEWRRAHAELVAGFRVAYLAELERFAETLRPRFEAGELYGYRDDLTGEERITAAIVDHFGLVVTETIEPGGGHVYTGDDAIAHLILEASPSALDESLGDSIQSNDWHHPALGAREAILFDVLGIARARGWYTPDEDEAPVFDHSRWAA